MDIQSIVFKIAVSFPGFLVAIICHEVAHGYVAMRFGDHTAKSAGRLNFNLMTHADPIGTLLIPLIGFGMGFPIIGWAKPVPINPRNFSNYKKGLFWVSFAGPLTNFVLGVFSAILMAICIFIIPSDFFLRGPFIQMLEFSILINFVLFLFNLIPLPPLDGSRMLSIFLDYNTNLKYQQLGNYTTIILLALLFTGALRYLFMPIIWLAQVTIALCNYVVLMIFS
ncbi:MAG: site-2 protease family protein [Bacteriovoracaceae bacterium]|jgi:Zn-dependent protease|nr:site-2 protease family protein [Bacteriovoracaceae bacterium]